MTGEGSSRAGIMVAVMTLLGIAVVMLLGTKTSVKVEVAVMALGTRTFVAVAVESMGVSVGKTRITGVLVGTEVGVSIGSLVGSDVGCSVGAAVSLAVWSRLGTGTGRGRSQELVEMTTTNATKSKHGILQTRLSIMGMPPLPVAV